MCRSDSDRYFESMCKEIEYLRGILNSLRPSSFRQNCDWSEVIEEQDTTLNTLRVDFATKLTDVEQRLKQNTVRIFGVKETPGEHTLSVVLGYFRKRLRVGVRESDIDCCHRSGKTGSRSIVVKFANDEARKRVCKRKEEVRDNAFLIEELCAERRKVRQIAVNAFGRDRVAVVEGTVRVDLPANGRQVKFATLSQINDFLRANSFNY